MAGTAAERPSQNHRRQVFERAQALAPSIVLIDELDAIAPCRGELTHQHDITLISQLLVLLDGMEERGRVIVIGTTNRLRAIGFAAADTRVTQTELGEAVAAVCAKREDRA